MKRWVPLSLLLYVPHLLEEHFTRMYDDPLIVAALGWVPSMSPREAVYLVFQAMWVGLLAALALFSLGGRGQIAVKAILALAMVGESHHVIRWLASGVYNSGLATSLPMPIWGGLLLHSVFKATAKPLLEEQFQ